MIRSHLSNAVYGVLDYGAYPVGMLIVAPIALQRLGLAQYGVWMFANAALTTGSVIASGFGDANIRHVALQRGRGDSPALLRTVRSTMGIHLALGIAMAAIAWMLVPIAAGRVVSADASLRAECLVSLRIASLLVLVRALESVCVSTQRAFERYGAAIGYSVLARLLSLASVLLPWAWHNVAGLMMATAALMMASLGMQLFQLKHLLQARSLWPSFDRETTQALFGFGIFSWIQAVAGVIFGQVDRLITGVALGAAAVASYAFCAQLAQPIYGIAASGLHFLFPYISARSGGDSIATLRRTIVVAFGANLVMVIAGATALLVVGNRLLTVWGGRAVAQSGTSLLPMLVAATAAQGLSVSGSYVLLALGRVRVVTFLNLAGGIAMLLIAPWLLPRYGAAGMAVARLFAGPFALLVYLPLGLMLVRASLENRRTSAAAICEEL
jgi:O-antigen/teichoic acid export membrane protein